MDRIDLWVKTGIGFLAGIVSILTGLFGVVFVVLLGLMAVDFITGVWAATYNEGLKSSVGRKGFIKKLYIILLIGAVFMIEFAVLGSNGIVGESISGAYCVIEFVSIVENGGRIGAPIPKKLQQIIATLKNKVGETEEEPEQK